MSHYEDNLVRLCILLILLLQHCSTGEDYDDEIVEFNCPSCAVFGMQVAQREIPHMAAIGWSQPNGTIIWQCGGSLIWENYVLTAAHCAADYNNTAPDVVRFGDLNLHKDPYGQQRKIIEIIRHPEHRFSQKYHDIALLRLKKKVRTNRNVIPTCLWNKDDIPFKRMEASGWGDTGFGEESSPDLLKVSLSPVDPQRCIQHYPNIRGLRAGLHANQICAGDAKMDTCRGDSGGPLHVNLVYSMSLTSFLVGVTSFGTACGHSIPGVYTRVAPYIPWIRSVLNARGENATEQIFQPHDCAKRFILLTRGINNHLSDEDYQQLLPVKRVLARSLPHVTIHWDGVIALKKNGCYGVVVDANTILTLASCTVIDGIPPSHIRYKGNHTREVSNYVRHPDYKENSLYNNIGLLKLKEPLVLSNNFFPRPFYLDDDAHVQQVHALSNGPRLVYPEIIEITADEDDPMEIIKLDALGYVHNASTCSLPSEYASLLEKGLTEELLCFGTDHHLVPDTCNLSVGGPIEVDVPHPDRFKLTHVYALNMLGRTCGHGESALGVKIAYHREWLQSMLVPKEDAPLIFLNDALEEGDHCVPAHGSDGICVEARYCPKVYYQFQTEGRARFCQTVSLVCCPREFIRNETDAEWRQIDECENHYVNNKSHGRDVVSLAWKTETGEKTCLGTIITSRTIVVAANCVAGTEFPAGASIQEAEGTVLSVERVIIHPKFDNSTKQHNIALIHMQERFNESFGKIAACLWLGDRYTPDKLVQYYEQNTYGLKVPYNSIECDAYFGKGVLQPFELCVQYELWLAKYLKGSIDAPVSWHRGTHYSFIRYLIGIVNEVSSDELNFRYTLVSPYVSWIKSML